MNTPVEELMAGDIIRNVSGRRCLVRSVTREGADYALDTDKGLLFAHAGTRVDLAKRSTGPEQR